MIDEIGIDRMIEMIINIILLENKLQLEIS